MDVNLGKVEIKVGMATAKALEKCDIIKFEGTSGRPTTADVAAEAPQVVRMVSSAGKAYDVEFDSDSRTFTFTPHEDQVLADN